MSHLKKQERDFLEQGGVLWQIVEVPGGWKVNRMSWESSTNLPNRPLSRGQAEALLQFLLDLSPDTISKEVREPSGDNIVCWP